MIKAVLFDLDNTLIDFLKMKKLSCEAAIDAMIKAGLNINHDDGIKSIYELYGKHGMEEKTIFQKFLIKLNKKIDYKILAAGIVAYRRVRSGLLEPYPNVKSVLLKLKAKGLKLGIVTDAARLKAWIRLESMSLSGYFDVIVTFEDTGQRKPSKLPFKAALKLLNLKPKECLMVGDWPERDIKGARAVGMLTCYARYGNLKHAKADADYEINDIKEVLKIAKNS